MSANPEKNLTLALLHRQTFMATRARVFLAHRGFVSTEGNFASVNYNWGWYVSSLKFYLEKGQGMPHTDADMS